MKKNHTSEFVPLGLLLIIGLGSTIQVMVTDYAFDYRHYIGLTLLLVSGSLYFKNRRLYKYIFGLTLTLGTFNLIAFSTYIIGINVFSIPIQIIPFLVLIVFCIMYKKQIVDLIFDFAENNEVEKQELLLRKIARFKGNFSGLSDEEIERKLNQELVPEAKIALEEIRVERKNELKQPDKNNA